MRTVITGLVIWIIAAPAVAQTGQADPPVYLVEYSSAPMIRNAALADVAVRVVERGSEWVFDKSAGDLFTRKSTGGVFARVGQTAFNVILEATGRHRRPRIRSRHPCHGAGRLGARRHQPVRRVLHRRPSRVYPQPSG